MFRARARARARASEVWGRCLFFYWQWRGNLCVAPHEGWGFLTVCSGEVVSVWLLLMSDVWGVSNSVGIASCCTCEGGGLVGGCLW